jgi:hypothetical protein
MNLKKTISSLTTNKYFLYFIVVIVAFNIIGYLSMHNTDAVIFFALVGFVSYHFSKNMTIVLLISFVATNLFMVARPFQSLEGMRTNKNNSEISDPMKGVDGFKDKKDTKDTDTKDTKDTKEGLKRKTQESFSELKPAPVKKSSHIDYATTLEDAYKNLEQMLGNGGLQNLTEDTKKLMEQQSKLFSSMENITPLLAQAQTMMKGMDMESINKFATLNK